MFLVTWNEEESTLEASLGGRVTHEEVLVLVEELEAMIADLDAKPFMLVLDYSYAKPFEKASLSAIAQVKDFSLKHGAVKIANVVRDEDDIPEMTTYNLQRVLEGIEDFVSNPSQIEWVAPNAHSATLRIAA